VNDAALPDSRVDLGIDDAPDMSPDVVGDPATDPEPDALDPSPADFSDVANSLPSTPAGVQLTWLIGMVNASAAGTYQLTQEDYDAHFAKSFRNKLPLADFSNSLLISYESLAPMDVLGYEEDTATDGAMWAQVHSSGFSGWARVGTVLEAGTGLIVWVGVATSPDLDPAFGPLAANQIGLYPQAQYEAANVAGFVVEAVDRGTGSSFDPPITGTVDAKYRYVRLTLPPGTGEVGIKATHTDGQVNWNFGPHLKAGKDRQWVAVYPATAFPSYASSVGLTTVAGKAQVWGVVYWDRGLKPWSLDFDDQNVGCATIAADPALDRVYYASPPLPDASATSTPWNNPSWYAFNVEPVPHTFEVQATGGPLVPSPFPLAADAVTVIQMWYDSTIWPTNPTNEDCGH